MALLVAVLLPLGAWHGPAAHSGAPGAYREAERPPGRTGPPTEGEMRGPHVCRVCRLAGRLEVDMTPAIRPARHRCGGPQPAPLHAVHPRGLVRPGTWTHVRVDLGEEIVPEASESIRIVFKVGHSVLGHVELAGERCTERVELPKDLRDALRGVRGCVTWGREDVDDERATSGVWIEAASPELRRRLESLELALHAEPLWIRHVLRAQALIASDHDVAALEEARAALDLVPDEPHAAAIEGYALRRLRYEGTRDLFEGNRRLDRVSAWLRTQSLAFKATCQLDDPWPEGRLERPPRAGCGPARRTRARSRR